MAGKVSFRDILSSVSPVLGRMAGEQVDALLAEQIEKGNLIVGMRAPTMPGNTESTQTFELLGTQPRVLIHRDASGHWWVGS